MKLKPKTQNPKQTKSLSPYSVGFGDKDFVNL